MPPSAFMGDTSASANTLCKCIEMDVFLIRCKTLCENRPSSTSVRGGLAEQPAKEAQLFPPPPRPRLFPYVCG